MSVPVGAASSVRTIAIAGGSSVIGVVPVFLVGSLAVFVRDDLAFDQAQLGLAIATFFLASAVSAVPAARLTERIGARRAVLACSVVSGVSMLGIALVAHTWPVLVVLLALAGLSNGMMQPAGNLALARGVTGRRKALAFGIKQSSIPVTTLIAGAAVPLVGLTVGWRWAFAGGAVAAVLLMAAMPGDPYSSPYRRRGRQLRAGDAPVLPLAVLAVGGACGSSAGTALASFYVESGVAAGFSAAFSGTMLVVGSASGILSRLALGWFADRRDRGHLLVIALLLSGGALGFVGLAHSAERPGTLLPSTLLAFAAGWAWPGLYNYAVVKRNPNAPAAASSITQTGIFVGGVIGPAVFGMIAESMSFSAAWTVAAGVNVIGAGCVLLSRRMLRAAPAPVADADRGTPTGRHPR